MTVKKWDYFTDALLAGQQSFYLLISLYMIFVIFAKYQAFFSFSSLSSRSRSAWDFLR